MDRYGGLLLAGFTVAGVLLIGFLVLQNATGRAYACAALLTPGPSAPVPTFTPSPEPTPTPSVTPKATPSPRPTPSPTTSPTPSPTPSPSGSAGPTESPTPSPSITPVPTPIPQPTQLVGFQVRDLGATHVTDPGTHITYQYCPPASGSHYNILNVGPIKRAFYGPDQEQNPGGWVHDLEHGYVVVAYSCKDGCPSAAELDAMRQAMDTAPQTDFAKACGQPNRMLVLRFDGMTTRFAYIAWDRVQLTDTLDKGAAITFMQQWQDQANPQQGTCDR